MKDPGAGSAVRIYDTTLRDGTQREGLSLSVDDKLRIAQRLDALGIAYIEGGWPGSNPKDAQFFARAREIDWKHAALAAFGSTRRVGVAAEEDANLQALIEAGTPVCTVFGKTWTLHVTDVIRTTLDDNLALIEDSVAYLVGQGRRVVFDAEHFFDGYRADADYAVACVEAAARGGAETVVLCDTNGGSLPWQIGEVVSRIVERTEVPVGIHAHNDSECAVANSVAAVFAGASHVQGTINGYGERCGNANLCAIVPNLELKMDRRCLPEGQLAHLAEVAHYVAEVANQAPDHHMAYVGKSAFAHKGGVHVSAIRRNETSYNHIDPALVGNQTRVVVSELSGRGNVLHLAEEMDVEVTGDVSEVVSAIKENEALGFSYEAAEASVALMVARQAADYEAPFQLIDFVVNVESRDMRGLIAEATVKVRVGGEVMHTAAEGDGPVNALDRALRKALEPAYPTLADVHLTDYKVRILDSDSATAAITRVLIYSSNGHDSWGTVGASTNIIDASWRALVDALEYGLRLQGAREQAAAAERGELLTASK